MKKLANEIVLTELTAAGKVIAAKDVAAGGPGSGRHPGTVRYEEAKHPATGLTHSEFATLATKVGTARNATRGAEDKLRREGNHEEANKLYEKAKENVRQLLVDHNVTAKDFDTHMKDFARDSGQRAPNVKLSRML